MKKATTAARIDPPISFHGLRHTWASLSVMAGMPLMVVARNLGHVNTKMVEKHYGHLAPSYVVEQIQKFAPKFGAVASNVKAIR